MKQILVYVFFAVLIIGPAHADQTLKLSAPPSIWVTSEGGELGGPTIELINEVFKEANISLESENLPWARAVEQMKSGRLDMIPVIFLTEERAQFMEFSIPYVEVPTLVFVPLGKAFPFQTLEDLIGKRGVVVRDDSISEEFQKIESKLELRRTANYEQMIKMLISGRADYAVAPKYGFIKEASKLNHLNSIEPLPVPVAKRGVRVAISKKSKYLKYIHIINNRLEQAIKDGTMEEIIKKRIQIEGGY